LTASLIRPSACAAPTGSSGNRPALGWRQAIQAAMASNSVSTVPSPSSSTGMLPLGLRARNSGRRGSPASRSTMRTWNGSSTHSSSRWMPVEQEPGVMWKVATAMGCQHAAF
jgi:hypothetical protein